MQPIKLFLLLFILATMPSFAQAPEIEWQKSFGGSGEDIAKAVVQTPDGNYVFVGDTNSSNGDVVGYEWSYSLLRRDYWIVKTNPVGDIIWQKLYGGFYNDLVTSIKNTTDGGFIVSGYSESYDGEVLNHIGNYDYWILKLDTNGDIEWQKTLGGGGEDYATNIIQTSDGGYITIGHTKSTSGGVVGNHGMFDIWIVKMSSVGVVEWRKAYGGSADDKMSEAYGNYSLIQTPEGGYLFTGKTKSTNGDITLNHGLNDIWLVKINAVGTIEWQKTFGGTADDFGQSLIATADGNYILTAGSASVDGDFTTNFGATDLWVIKIDPLGNIIWKSSFGGTNSESYQYSNIIETHNGELLVCSYTTSTNIDATGNHSYGSYDAWLVKLSSSGEKQWHRCYGGRNWDEGLQVIQTNDNGFMIAGYNSAHHDPTGADWTVNHGTYDAWLIKLAPEALATVDFKSHNTQLMIYPNPATNSLTITSSDDTTFSKIVITDVAGRTILTKTDNLSEINIENFSKGIYLIQAISGKNVLKSKFIKE